VSDIAFRVVFVIGNTSKLPPKRCFERKNKLGNQFTLGPTTQAILV
jgi:hypothetical protein